MKTHYTYQSCELGCELDGTTLEVDSYEDVAEGLLRHPAFIRGGGFFSGMNGRLTAAGLTKKLTTEWDNDSRKMVEVARWHDSSGKIIPLLEEKFSYNPTSEQASARIGSERMNGIVRPNQDSFGFFLHCFSAPHLLVEAWMQEGESELHIKVGEGAERKSVETKNGLEITCASCNVTEKINWEKLEEKVERLRSNKKSGVALIFKTPWRSISS